MKFKKACAGQHLPWLGRVQIHALHAVCALQQLPLRKHEKHAGEHILLTICSPILCNGHAKAYVVRLHESRIATMGTANLTFTSNLGGCEQTIHSASYCQHDEECIELQWTCIDRMQGCNGSYRHGTTRPSRCRTTLSTRLPLPPPLRLAPWEVSESGGCVSAPDVPRMKFTLSASPH
eukprot:131158-Chlamydomonas_euryale.AAC.12